MAWNSSNIQFGAQCLTAFYRACKQIFPRRQRILFLSRQANFESLDFKLLRREILARHRGYQVVSLCKQLDNLVSYVPHLFKQIFYLATSRAVVLDSYSIAVSMLADEIDIPVLQIWHGIGNMKKFGYTALDTSEGHSHEVAEQMRMHSGYDSVLISSMSFVDDFAAGLGVSESIMYECPLPRCDALTDRAEQERDRQALHRLSGGRPVVVYAPTFRRHASTGGEVSGGADLDAVDLAAIRALVSALSERGYAVAYQAHPIAERGRGSTFIDPRLITDFSSCPAGFNLVRAGDALVSDYSTIIYEAGLAGVPVYLYGYDWDRYQQNRGLYIDPSQDIPTVFSTSATEVAQAIADGQCDMDQFGAFVRRNVAMPPSGTCAARAVDHLFDLIHRA